MLANEGRKVVIGNRNILRIGVLGAVAALLASGLTLGAGAAGYAEESGPSQTTGVQPAEVEIEIDGPAEQPPAEQAPAEQPPSVETGGGDEVGEEVGDRTPLGSGNDNQKPRAAEDEQPNLPPPGDVVTPVEPVPDTSGDSVMQDITFEAISRDTPRETGPDASAKAINMGFLWSDDETSVWDIRRKGVEIDADGFGSNESIAVTVGSSSPISAKADANGRFNIILRATATAGTYTVKLAATSQTLTDELTVFTDASWWANFNESPNSSSDWFVISVARLARTGNEWTVMNFPYDTYVDLYINGQFIESIYHPYYFDYRLKGSYQPGDLKVEFRHPVKTVKSKLSVVSDTAGVKPATGTYAGTTTQTHASSTQLESRTSRKFRFTVDDSGKLTGIAGTYWWSCVSAGGYHGSGFGEFEDSGFPATRITKDRPFEIKWSSTSTSFSLSGVVRADGTASGRIWASLGACGTSWLTWRTAKSSRAFVDVPTSHKFYLPIQWMHTSGLSTGTRRGGVAYYYPKQGVTREAMAAFLYRLSGSPAFTAPRTSPFADLTPSSKFYKEITWLAQKGITTGVKQSSGKPKFLPKGTVTREAMAAFLYRFEGKPKFTAPSVSPFADLNRGSKFYKEITWLAKTGITTGVKQPSGKRHYQPKNRVTREAMAAFIYRLEN